MFILRFGSNRNASYLFRATSATAPLIVRMHSNERGVAIALIYPNPAISFFF